MPCSKPLQPHKFKINRGIPEAAVKKNFAIPTVIAAIVHSNRHKHYYIPIPDIKVIPISNIAINANQKYCIQVISGGN